MDFITRNLAKFAAKTQPATATYITTITGGASANYVVGSATIPASTKPRLVVLAMGLSNSTLTFTYAAAAGISLTVTNYVAGTDNCTAAIAYGIIPPNTSGSLPVSATFSGTNGASSGAAISVYVCDNVSSPSPIATFTSDCGNGSTTPVAISLASKPNGLVIAAFSEANSAGGLVTWATSTDLITEDYDAAANSRVASTAHGETYSTTFTGTFTTTSTNTNKALIVMSFR